MRHAPPLRSPHTRLQRAVEMACLILAGGAIYTLPYLRQSYPAAMREAMGVTNTELGMLNAMFGLLALLCYAPGGWLADRISPRKLLSISLGVTGLAGLGIAAFPPYPVLLALHGVWGISTILTFWAALIKATRSWGSADEQGRAFGILDGGRGIVEAVLGMLALALFAVWSSSAAGLGAVITMYALVNLGAGAAVWMVIPDAPRQDHGVPRHVGRGNIRRVIRLPAVWLTAAVILLAYTAYWGTFNLAAFATDGFGQSDTFGAGLSTVRMWTRPAAAVTAGLLADRLGASNVVRAGFTVLVVAFALLATMPTSADHLWLLWLDTIVVAAAVFALRGVYYALLEEGQIPRALTGTAVGLVSVLGYTPDVIMPLATGWALDAFPGAEGHRYLFAGMAVVAVLGVFATQAVRRSVAGDTERAELDGLSAVD